MNFILILLQVFAAILEIILVCIKKPAYIASYLKAGIFLLNGNASYAGFMLTNGTSEITSSIKENLKTPIVPVLLIIFIFIGGTMDFSLSSVLISAGIVSFMYDIWIENENSRINHLYWLIADIMAGYYILAVGEMVCVLRGFFEIVVEEWEKCKEEEVRQEED